jgi:hypothetical protein
VDSELEGLIKGRNSFLKLRRSALLAEIVEVNVLGRMGYIFKVCCSKTRADLL